MRRMTMILLCLALGLAVGACTSSGADPDELCDGISRESGGCDQPQPTFQGGSCEAISVEVGRQIDERESSVIRGPDSVGGKHRTVLVTQAIWLVIGRADQHATRLGIQCPVDLAWPVLEAQLSRFVRDGIGAAFSDPPNYTQTYEDFADEVKRSLRALASNEIGQ